MLRHAPLREEGIVVRRHNEVTFFMVKGLEFVKQISPLLVVVGIIRLVAAAVILESVSVSDRIDSTGGSCGGQQLAGRRRHDPRRHRCRHRLSVHPRLRPLPDGGRRLPVAGRPGHAHEGNPRLRRKPLAGVRRSIPAY